MTSSASFQPWSLAGRVALVTGAASGIGRGSADLLAWAGADVVLVDVDETGLKETAADLAGHGGRTAEVAADVRSREQVDAAVRRAVDEFGRLDVVANVAGITLPAMRGRIVDTTEDDLDALIAVNVKGVFWGMQAAMRVMEGNGRGGSIVNITSTAIDTPLPGIGVYAMTKAAIVMLTRTGACEGGPAGIRVNAVAPGFVPTPMTAGHARQPDGTIDEEEMEAVNVEMARLSPLARVGTVDDVAQCVLYLASDAARFMTGQILRPNGGVSMPW
jgi:3-oxoacyl-[acyl-carrier protein] reductase